MQSTNVDALCALIDKSIDLHSDCFTYTQEKKTKTSNDEFRATAMAAKLEELNDIVKTAELMEKTDFTYLKTFEEFTKEKITKWRGDLFYLKKTITVASAIFCAFMNLLKFFGILCPPYKAPESSNNVFYYFNHTFTASCTTCDDNKSFKFASILPSLPGVTGCNAEGARKNIEYLKSVYEADRSIETINALGPYCIILSLSFLSTSNATMTYILSSVNRFLNNNILKEVSQVNVAGKRFLEFLRDHATRKDPTSIEKYTDIFCKILSSKSHLGGTILLQSMNSIKFPLSKQSIAQATISLESLHDEIVKISEELDDFPKGRCFGKILMGIVSILSVSFPLAGSITINQFYCTAGKVFYFVLLGSHIFAGVEILSAHLATAQDISKIEVSASIASPLKEIQYIYKKMDTLDKDSSVTMRNRLYLEAKFNGKNTFKNMSTHSDRAIRKALKQHKHNEVVQYILGNLRVAKDR